MRIERLDWDSEFFGYEVGKLMWSENLNVSEFLLSISENQYKVVYIFTDFELPELNLNPVDIKVTYQRSLGGISPSLHDNKIASYSYAPESFSQLLDLALESGVYSRFNVDTNFKKKEYKRLYSEWIKQSVLNKKAFDCLVYLEKKNIAGFATLEKRTASLADIGLVAVDKNARGKGVGTSIIKDAMSNAKDRGYSEIQVVTQKANIPAMRLYEKCGFKVQRISHIYHYWNL